MELIFDYNYAKYYEYKTTFHIIIFHFCFFFTNSYAMCFIVFAVSIIIIWTMSSLLHSTCIYVCIHIMINMDVVLVRFTFSVLPSFFFHFCFAEIVSLARYSINRYLWATLPWTKSLNCSLVHNYNITLL